MEIEVLTKENYIKRHDFLSFTRFSKFLKCEAAGAVNYYPEPTTAMLVGSYVDAVMSNELDEFLPKHPEILKKDGTLKADFIKGDEIVKRIQSDETFMYYMSGEKQKIMTGVIGGVKFKIKIDSYLEGKAITDMKVMKDFQKVWTGRSKENFIIAYNYDIELAIFREIVRQNTGLTLPCFLAAVTKEDPADIAIFELSETLLDEAFEIVLNNIGRIEKILKGEVAPHRCETCEYCRKTKKARVIPYDLAGSTGDELKEVGLESYDPKLEVKVDEK